MIRLEDVTLTVGTRELFSGASLHVRPGDRVGLVGPNGAGKSSLLKLLAGELEPEVGAVSRRSGITVGTLPQAAVSGSTATVWEEASSRMAQLQALRAALAAAEEAVAAGAPGGVERLSAATEAFRLGGGYAADERIGTVLHGLGFGPDAWHRTCDTFSGGWQMRIALARLLLSDPDVILLDEPTNHLDLTARSWLADHLAGLSATLVVVSHDRHLLDRATMRTVEIRHGGLEDFAGPLSAWLVERAARDERLEAAVTRQDAEIARLEGFIDRFGAKATKAAQARSRQKQLDRIERLEGPKRDASVRLRLPEAPSSDAEVVALRGVALGYDDGPDVIEDATLTLRRGERWAFLGPNGAGKSTLLAAIAGALTPRRGTRKLGRGVRPAVYRQDLAAELPPDGTALDVALAAAPLASPAAARAALGALGLRGDAALREIRHLSGGEKARVVLAGFALQPANLMLLDEPTNHLDAVTAGVLAEALATFEGVLVLVTHDRWLVERLATHVAVVRGGRVEVSEGVRPEHLQPTGPAATMGQRAHDEGGEGADAHAARKARQRQRDRDRKRFSTLERDIARLEARIADVDAQLLQAAEAGDHEAAAGHGAARDALDAEMEAAFEELAALEEALAAD